MTRARFALKAFRRGLPPSWTLLRQILSGVALLGLIAGLRIAGLPLPVAAVLAAAFVMGVLAEGAYRLWSDSEDQLAALRAAQPAASDDLVSLLQEQLRRGRRLRATARISDDGTAGALESWEADVAMLLEDAGRQDLVERFEASEFADKARAALSGPWSTRRRIDRRLASLGAFLEGQILRTEANEDRSENSRA